MTRIPVNPELLSWARERAGLDALALAGRFPKLGAWESGKRLPTLRQLEDFAHAVHVPIGFLFLPAPPDEPLPIPDFRTLADCAVAPEGVTRVVNHLGLLGSSAAKHAAGAAWNQARLTSTSS